MGSHLAGTTGPATGATGPTGLQGPSAEVIGGGEISTSTGNGDFMGLYIGHSSTEAQVTQGMTVTGTLSDFRVRIDAAPASNKGLRYTVRKNGVDTAVFCEITDTTTSTTSCTDTTHSVGFTADTDTITIGVTTATGKTAVAAIARWTAKYTQP